MNRLLKFFFVAIALVIISFPLVYKIKYRPIQMWDESRNAVNAIEMLKSENYLVRTFKNKYDSWETKPPLLIWLQVASMKVFGYNVFAIRFPSMVAALLSCFVIILFFNYFLKDPVPGFVSAFILVTSEGFTGAHVSRTGDHDALLVLFSLLISLTAFIYFQSADQYKREKYILFFWMLLTLAFFTKSSASLIILPGLLAYSLREKKLIPALKSKWFYGGLAIFSISVFSYYFLHERATPGYIRDVWQNEFFPRASNTATHYQYEEGHWYYYLQNLATHRFFPWIYLMIISIIVLSRFRAKTSEKKFVNCLLINAFCFLIVISAVTKNEWYDAPIIPMLSMVTGISIVFGVRQVNVLFGKNRWIKIPVVLIVLALSYACYSKTISSIAWDNSNEDNCFGQYLKNTDELDKSSTYVLYHTGFDQSPLFYVEALSLQGYNIALTNVIDSVKSPDFILTSREDDIALLNAKYPLREFDRKGKCIVYARK